MKDIFAGNQVIHEMSDRYGWKEGSAEKTVLHGEPVTRLMYKQDNEVYQTQEEIPFYAKQTRLVLKNCGHIDAEHIEDALAVGAYEAFEKSPNK